MQTVTSLLRCVERAAATVADDRTLRQQVIEVLVPALRADGWVWVLTDPITTVGTSPLAHVPPSAFAVLPTTIRLRYLAGGARWSSAPGQRGIRRLSTLGHDPTIGDSRWRDHLAEHAIHECATITFVDRFGVWGFLDLWRRTPFAAPELALLDALPTVITPLVRRQVAATFVAPAPAAAGQRGPVVLVLDDELRVHGQTPLSDTWLGQLLPPDEGRSPVPASAYNVAAQLLAAEAGVDLHEPEASTHLVSGTWVTLRAARLTGTARGSAGIAVTIEEASPDTRRERFARAHGLTPREREILAKVAEGLDTEQIAREFVISRWTVQDHLKSVFRKSGTSTRHGLVARATGR